MNSPQQDTSHLNTQQKSAQELDFLTVLDSRIVGQVAAKEAAARAFRRAKNPLRNRRGPVYKVLLVGQSRTGKTLTAETTALSLHGNAEALLRIDCAEYQNGHEVSRLLGAPPSYRDSDDPSSNSPIAILARQNLIASRKGSACPITVILLDEIEKAHASLKDLLLAIFDKGKTRLANNCETDFTDCMFFLTSNLGMEQLEEFGHIRGFCTQKVKPIEEKDVAAVVTKELRNHFRPEFLKRLDETVIFAPLSQNQLEKLVEMELGFVQDRIVAALPPCDQFEVQFTPDVQSHVLRLAQENDGGVAEVKQVIERDIIDTLGGELEKGTIVGGDVVVIGFDKQLEVLTFHLADHKNLSLAQKQSREPAVDSEPAKWPAVGGSDGKRPVLLNAVELRQLVASFPGNLLEIPDPWAVYKRNQSSDQTRH
jgi:ATP-dependent Clp protease ATP-binding subunit ClpA